MSEKPIALIILGGWGHREEKEHNAIAETKKYGRKIFAKNFTVAVNKIQNTHAYTLSSRNPECRKDLYDIREPGSS